jgi:5'-3' exonuclease
MILLVDADSLIFASCYDKYQDGEPKYFTDIKDSVAKYEQQFFDIVNTLEDSYDIKQVITFNGSKGNFRKILNRDYKQNRKQRELPPLLHEMHKYVKENFDSVSGYGVETDDMVARFWKRLSDEIGRDNVMIVSLDKDYKQFPCLLYNYHFKHKTVYDISESTAMYNFYEQMIIGDQADNVNFFKGKGRVFAKKYLDGCKTKYQYTKRMYELFKDTYKSKARERYIECFNLLKLRTR